jgi:hypothetical protein
MFNLGNAVEQSKNDLNKEALTPEVEEDSYPSLSSIPPRTERTLQAL